MRQNSILSWDLSKTYDHFVQARISGDVDSKILICKIANIPALFQCLFLLTNWSRSLGATMVVEFRKL